MVRPQLTLVPTTGSSAGGAGEVLEGLAGFIQQQAEHYRFNPNNAAELAEKIGNDARFSGMDAHALNEVIVNAFERMRKEVSPTGAVTLPSAKQVTFEHVLAAADVVSESAGRQVPPRPEMLAQLKQQVETNAAADKARAAAKKPSWSHALSTEQKVNAGLWGAGALLSGIGMYYAVKNSRTVDENGKPDIRWTQVGVALLQAAMTAGCAFMAYEATRGAAIR